MKTHQVKASLFIYFFKLDSTIDVYSCLRAPQGFIWRSVRVVKTALWVDLGFPPRLMESRHSIQPGIYKMDSIHSFEIYIYSNYYWFVSRIRKLEKAKETSSL